MQKGMVLFSSFLLLLFLSEIKRANIMIIFRQLGDVVENPGSCSERIAQLGAGLGVGGQALGPRGRISGSVCQAPVS